MKHLLSLRGFILELLLFTAVSKGCDGPSAPQCFRRDSKNDAYECEWSTPFTDHNHSIHFRTGTSSDKVIVCERPNWTTILEEDLIKSSEVDIWVEPDKMPHCKSPETRALLGDIIKYEMPQNVSVLWSQDNLTLTWTAPEIFQAAVEIWHRVNSSQTWNKIHRNTTVSNNNQYAVTVAKLTKPSVQQLQMRHRSTKAKNPLWSDWAKILTVPIEFTRISKKVNIRNIATELQRRVTLRWKPVTHADGDPVSYQVQTKFCMYQSQENTSKTYFRTYGTYSAVNISVIALNAASSSPAVHFHVPPENPPNLKLCDGTALNLKTQAYSEWFELQNGKVKEDTVIILLPSKGSKANKQKTKDKLKEFLPYIYFEHHCSKKITSKMCLYYKKQGKPLSPPQHLITSAENPDSATLSWEPISTEKQGGLILNYTLCIQSTSSKQLPDCRNISSSLRSYTLQGLTSNTRYNVSLTAVTEGGAGPKARVTINTPPEKPYNVGLSFGLLVSFFVLSTSCTFIFTRIKNKVLPPVPTPVIPGFTAIQADVQDLKEEVHKVTLVQLHPEGCPAEDERKGGTLDVTLDGIRDAGSSLLEDDDDRSSQIGSEDNEQTPKDLTEEDELIDPDRVQNEIALLIYRNGLVFDVNVDSS